ncbi:hypothetical protein [Marinoscillum furvescens]|uniref:Uncharacterized protein n=1 Tax=Marinoscillum furvescens DSM 4134 TaxID=1122208 RepID=A0A3D9L675_MARFU|nr:hypothetical protein [Marinoscillum furvescens]REE00097.1 hypothetical protein C7460_10634 [Marinoscillum furvescens DSM 4134]
MTKLFKILGLLVLVLFLSFTFLGVSVHESLPQGQPGLRAERLADSLLSAVGYDGYQNLETIRWSYPPGHHYVWDKQQDSVQVSWDEFTVMLSTESIRGYAYRGERPLSGEQLDKVLWKAWEYFANDSFWLVAPFKVRDPGTSRSYVETDRGHGLLVTYSSGGVTPGDSYLWVLDKHTYRPVAWQMWVSIIPVGGVEFSWENWQQYGEVWFADHHLGPLGFTLQVEDLTVD